MSPATSVLVASPSTCPFTHIQIVFQALSRIRGKGILGEVLGGPVEGVSLQIVLQQALLNQVLPQGLLSDQGDPRQNSGSYMIRGIGIKNQGSYLGDAAEARETSLRDTCYRAIHRGGGTS